VNSQEATLVAGLLTFTGIAAALAFGQVGSPVTLEDLGTLVGVVITKAFAALCTVLFGTGAALVLLFVVPALTSCLLRWSCLVGLAALAVLLLFVAADFAFTVFGAIQLARLPRSLRAIDVVARTLPTSDETAAANPRDGVRSAMTGPGEGI